jgi:hypothetical protein
LEIIKTETFLLGPIFPAIFSATKHIQCECKGKKLTVTYRREKINQNGLSFIESALLDKRNGTITWERSKLESTVCVSLVQDNALVVPNCFSVFFFFGFVYWILEAVTRGLVLDPTAEMASRTFKFVPAP